MPATYQQPTKSKSASQFIEALLTDQISANYDLPLPRGASRFFIDGFTLVAKENLAFELWLFDKAANLTGDPETDGLVAMWAFMATVAGGVGFTVAPAAGGGNNALFRYFIDGNQIPYHDLDATDGDANLHVRLVNRSAAAKSADAAGALVLTAYASLQGAQR